MIVPRTTTPRAFEIICEEIRSQLASGALKAGDKLPPERELAARFNVGRNALREALRSLEVAGIIRNLKGVKGGSFIQSAEPSRVTRALQDYVQLGDVSLDELTEARVAIQDIIVRLACRRARSEDLDELEAIAQRTRDETGVDARYECAVAFYCVLARATDNQMFGIFVSSLSAILNDFVRVPGYETLQSSLVESRLRLVKHLRNRDCDAAAAEMRNHLERLHRHIRKNLKASGIRTARNQDR